MRGEKWFSCPFYVPTYLVYCTGEHLFPARVLRKIQEVHSTENERNSSFFLFLEKNALKMERIFLRNVVYWRERHVLFLFCWPDRVGVLGVIQILVKWGVVPHGNYSYIALKIEWNQPRFWYHYSHIMIASEFSWSFRSVFAVAEVNSIDFIE